MYYTHYTLYGEKNEYMVNFQIVYLVGMSVKWEMSKEVSEKWPLILSWKLLEKTLNRTKKNRWF